MEEEEYIEEDDVQPQRLSKEEMERLRRPKRPQQKPQQETTEKKPALQGQDLILAMEKEILFLRGKVEAYEKTLKGGD